MKNFLKQLQLSEEAISVYMKSLGKFPMTQSELSIIIPNLSPEELGNIANELVQLGLLIPIDPKSPEVLLHYFAIPPVAPILNYYANINQGLTQIEEAVKNLMLASLNQLFLDNNPLSLENLLAEYLVLKEDINEEILIQKQDVEDLMEEIQAVNAIKTIFKGFHEKILSITQTQFATLIKTLTKIKTSIQKQVDILEIKKGEDIKDAFKLVVENVFKEKLQQMIGDFTSNLYGLIETEFANLDDPINDINIKLIQLRDDFKMLYLNAISNFEDKMNKTQQLIERNKNSLNTNLENLKGIVIQQMDSIIQDSLKQISNLNSPVINVMQEYVKMIGEPNKFVVNNIWLIESSTKINETISTIIANSKQQITIIIPKIEKHLQNEQFQNLAPGIQVRIIASDPHVNTTVKTLKEKPGITYKKLENDTIILLKGDNNIIVIAIMQAESQDPLNNIIGFGTNYPPLIGMLTPILETTWASARGEIGQPISTPSSTLRSAQSKTIPHNTGPKPSAIAAQQKSSVTTPIQQRTLQPSPQSRIQPQFERPQLQPTPQNDPVQPAPSQVDYSSPIQAKPGDKVGELISNAFDAFISQIPNLKGPELGKALLDVTDIILEQKGYSVTLNSIRKAMTEIKQKDRILTEEEKQELLINIQEWKRKLLQ
ncbi:MAG: hypothetical protein ACTSR8_21900 [Promethearchaeota archaeon]